VFFAITFLFAPFLSIPSLTRTGGERLYYGVTAAQFVWDELTQNDWLVNAVATVYQMNITMSLADNLEERDFMWNGI
jgi:hypothetical protein